MLAALDQMEVEIAGLNRQVEEEVKRRPAAMRLRTHPGVGPVTALGHGADAGAGGKIRIGQASGQLFWADPERALQRRAAAVGANQQAGQFFLRFLLVEAGQTAVRYDAELGRFYRRLARRKHRALAKVAVARKLAMRLYLMLREDWDYAQLCKAMCRQA